MLEIYRVLRDLRVGGGFTQTGLAVELEVSRDTVARIETGAQRVTVEYLLKFGSVMQIHPVDIVRRMEGNEQPFVYLFRANKSSYFTDDIRTQFETWYNQIEELNGHAGISRLRQIPPKDYGIIDNDNWSFQGAQSAKWLREKWKMGSCPVVDPVDLIESLGYYITGMDLGENDLFAITGRKGNNGRPGIVVNINHNITIERQRFSIIHELGHIVEHGEEFEEQPDYSGYGRNKDDREKFADAFAAAFLIPKDELTGMYEKMVQPILENTIIILKGYFKVSYQALMIRLFDAGLLDMDERTFWQKFGMLKRRYGKSEPVPITGKLEFKQEREMQELIIRSDQFSNNGASNANPNRKFLHKTRFSYA